MEQWTILKLKSELKARGATQRGKKADLISRLQAYIRNDNFVQKEQTATTESHYRMKRPSQDAYKDIHGESKLPKVTEQRINLFLQRFGKSLTKGPVSMYVGQYLQCARHAPGPQDGMFILGICRAQMKQVCYQVDMFINEDGSVGETQCECAAGIGPDSHCKHVSVLLLAVKDVVEKGKINTAEVCTQKLQTFHKPRRPFNGSPVKASNLKKRVSSPSVFDPRPQHWRKVDGYNDSFRNLCVAYSATHHGHTAPPRGHPDVIPMPIMQAIIPANPFAIANDHNYSGEVSSNLLKDLGLDVITEDRINSIEMQTRGQSNNTVWKNERLIRITSSRFKDVVCATERRDLEKLAESIVNPQKFVSKYTEHGIVNEPVAIRKFEEATGNKVQGCGLFVVETHPFLGASPDGLLCEATVVEVKCPWTARKHFISPTTVPYLEMVNGKLQLKKTHSYYYQIMGQLLATKRQFCDLIIYTYVDLKVISIARDNEAIQNMLEPLSSFFKMYLFPSIMNKYVYKGYTGQK